MFFGKGKNSPNPPSSSSSQSSLSSSSSSLPPSSAAATTGGASSNITASNKNLNNSSGNSTPTQPTSTITSPLGPLTPGVSTNNLNTSTSSFSGMVSTTTSSSSLIDSPTTSTSSLLQSSNNGSGGVNVGGINILSGTPINPNQDGGPPILNKLTRYLLAKGTTVENIFKPQTESENEVTIVKKNLLKDLSVGDNIEQIQISTYTNNPHVVSEILKQYLYSLPEPLFSYHLYDSFLLTHTIVSQQDRLWSYRFLLAYLPLGFRGAIKSLIGLLNKVHNNHGETKMDSQVLASIFAPVFLRPEEEMYYMKTDRLTTEEIIKFWIEDFDIISKPPTSNAIPGTSSIIGGNRGGSFLTTQPSFLNRENPQQSHPSTTASSNSTSSLVTSPLTSLNTNSNKEEAHPLSPLSHPTIGLNKSSTNSNNNSNNNNNNLTNATNPQQSPKLSLPTIPKQQNTQQTTTVIKIKTPLQATSNSKSNPSSPSVVSPTVSSAPSSPPSNLLTIGQGSTPTKDTVKTNTISTPTSSPAPKQQPRSPAPAPSTSQSSPNVFSPSLNIPSSPSSDASTTPKKIPLTLLSTLDADTIEKINKVKGTTESLINDYIWKQLKLIAKNIEIETSYTTTIKLSTILRDSKRHLIDSSQQLLSISKNDVKSYIKENPKPQAFVLSILTNEQITTNVGLYGEDSKHFELKRASHLATEELADYIYFLKSKIHRFLYKEHVVLTAQTISKLKTILESGSPQPSNTGAAVDHAARTLGMSGGMAPPQLSSSTSSLSSFISPQSNDFSSSSIRSSTGSSSGGGVEDEIKTTLRIVEVCSREINERLSIIRRDLENAPLNEAIEMGKAIRSSKQTLTELYNENGYPLPVDVKVMVDGTDDQLTTLKKTLMSLLDRISMQTDHVCKIVNTQTSQGIPPDQDCKNIIDKLLFINKVLSL